MKKTLITIAALAGIAQANAAYVTGDNFAASDGEIDLVDVATSFKSDTFAISFNLDKSLTEINSINEFFSFVLGGSSSYRVDIASMGSVMTMSAGNKNEYIMDPPSTSGPFVLQIYSNGDATLLYDNYGSLETIRTVVNPVYSIPDVVDSATLTLSQGVSVSNLTVWEGEVTAEDLANPTPAPAPTPSVPEPTTATLSLLALAGLAARRRRR